MVIEYKVDLGASAISSGGYQNITILQPQF